MLVLPGSVDVDIHQNREGRAHPSPFTVTRLHALFPAGKFDRPLIVEALARLRSRSCIIDGEAVACDGSGIAQINRIRYRSYDSTVFLYAFDLIELNGDDLRCDPLEARKATLASTLAKAGPGVRLNEHLECDDGETVFRHACKMGLEGIVSKRKDSFAGKHPRGAAPLPRAATRRAGLATDRHDVARGDGELLLIVEDRANSAQDVPHAG